MQDIIRVELPDDLQPQECDSVLAIWVGAYLWGKYGPASVGAPDLARLTEALAEFDKWSRATEEARGALLRRKASH